MGIFHSYVSLPEGILHDFWHVIVLKIHGERLGAALDFSSSSWLQEMPCVGRWCWDSRRACRRHDDLIAGIQIFFEFHRNRDIVLRYFTAMVVQWELNGLFSGWLRPSQTVLVYGYGSIPINTIFRGMNIHKSQLFWCELQGYTVLTHCHIWNHHIHNISQTNKDFGGFKYLSHCFHRVMMSLIDLGLFLAGVETTNQKNRCILYITDQN